MGLTIEQRRQWANRNGNPLWLWPEVAPTDWLAALGQLEQAVRATLTGAPISGFHGDALALRLAGYTSGLGPMLGFQGVEAFREQFAANSARMEVVIEQAERTVALLVRGSIDVLVLKGAHTALAYFPEPGCRPMSDIDLLIRPEQRAAAHRILEGVGFELMTQRPLESCWRLRGTAARPANMVSLEPDDPWTLDLHYSLDIEGPPGASAARLSLSAPFTGARSWPGHPSAGCLGQPALLLHLAAHAGSGFQNLTMMRLLELLLVSRKDETGEDLDWEAFLSLGRATGALAFAYPALKLAHDLSPSDLPQKVVAQCAAAAPGEVRRLVNGLTPATAHRIDRRSLREHYAWTQGFVGWLRRLRADVLPDHRSLRRSLSIQRSRANALFGSYSAAGRR